MGKVQDTTLRVLGNSIKNAAADALANSDFISRTIGMNNSYEDIMFIVQSLGREPVSLLGKNYAFIYDHVRRNYMQGMDVPSKNFEYCNKFTFYKEAPTVRFADPYNDPMNLLDRWKPTLKTLETMIGETTLHYSESNDGYTNNKAIDNKSDLDSGNLGTAHGSIESYQPTLQYCDMIGKTNSNFNHGKYQTLIARFHTNTEESRDFKNPTQTAFSNGYGQSHGRNLLNITPDEVNGYNNPYCRVWTYHHQYNQIKRQIRPFYGADSQEKLESKERGKLKSVGFRTLGSDEDKFADGSKRLDDYGVLNYQNGTVNIAPTAKIKDYFYGNGDKGIISIKKCMFSIENLAWRDIKSSNDEFDVNGLSPEQKGPLGGRIMWFPPYDLQFNEDVSVDWNPNKFIGRGENVYTYTNTERSGNISFTLLIDHPSILDYWTGHNRNGMKNQGTTLTEGNSGGVDNVNNQENTLLRFFAGCDILSAKPHIFRTKVVKPDKVKEPTEEENKKDTPPESDEVTEGNEKQICAILYFPNNYSGVNDGGDINPIWYLMNGVGTQKYVNPITKDADDIPTVIDVAPSGGNGGYELGSNGISQVSNEDVLEADYNVIRKTYADTDTIDKKAQYLTYKNGSQITISYGTKSYALAKIIGSEALPLGSAKNKDGSISSNVTGPKHLWYRKRYYYRVDKEYENQEFSNSESYIDGVSERLNGKNGFNKVREKSPRAVSDWSIQEDSTNYKLVSFADIFVALESSKNTVNSSISENADNNSVLEIREIFTNKDKYPKVKIEIQGHASTQGYVKENEKLARNRAETLKKWLNGLVPNNVELDEVDVKLFDEYNDHSNIGNSDSLESKIWRSASMSIKYTTADVKQAAINITKTVDKNGVNIVDSIEVKNKTSSLSQAITNSLLENGTKEFYDKMWEIHDKATNENHLDPTDWETYDNSYLKLDDYKQGIVPRYDNEGEFFEVLTKDAPFLHHLITDKIKYFDPAFHSISPEGFNARLTFLHQCTRQGSTVEQSSFDSSTAYNLAFGRPPVCVLRLGDFFNTKIIITNLNIQYENAQWDMNTEGIGMMPMFAKISLNFKFLGGSDISGPIARLQNAVSFNYYANTSIYDNRAEKVEYDPKGSGKEINFKGFVYPSENNN